MSHSTQKTVLYRYFDSEGQLLYVGITGDNTKRQSQHKRDSFWFGEIHSATFCYFDSRKEASQAEIYAIENELPLYNTAHTKSKKPAFDFMELSSKYHLLSILSGFDINKVPLKIDPQHTNFKNCVDLFDLDCPEFTMDELLCMQLEDLIWRKTLGEVELQNLDTCDLCVGMLDSNWYSQTLTDLDTKIQRGMVEARNATH